MNEFLDRPLTGEWPYVWLDVTYLKVPQGGRIVNVAAIPAACAATRAVFCPTGRLGNRTLPVLARMLERFSKSDTLVVVRIDTLARSLSHLLEVIERLEAKSAFFRSLTDPTDMSSPQGMFTLHVLGAAAEFERAMIAMRERKPLGRTSWQPSSVRMMRERAKYHGLFVGPNERRTTLVARL